MRLALGRVRGHARQARILVLRSPQARRTPEDPERVFRLAAVTMAAALSLGAAAHAAAYQFDFTGPGVSGTVALTYGPATDTKYPEASVVTGINGVVSDSTLGIVDAPILGLEPRTFATPEPDNLLAPNSFSRFAVATGLPADNHGVLTYDNLFWPAGSLPTASDYTAHGGFLDIYGLMVDIGAGRVMDFWSNGDGGTELSATGRRASADPCESIVGAM